MIEAVDPGKSRQLFPLLNKCLDDPNAADRLLHLIRQLREGPLFGEKLPVHHLAVNIVPIHDQQQRNHRYQSQTHVNIEHHFSQHHQQHHCRVKGRHHSGRHQHSDGLKVVDEVGHQISCLMFVEIAGGQRLQMGKQLSPQISLNGQSRSENKVSPGKPSHRHACAQQDDPAYQLPHAIHINGPRLQPVGDLAGELGDIYIHEIHHRQRKDTQHV